MATYLATYGSHLAPLGAQALGHKRSEATPIEGRPASTNPSAPVRGNLKQPGRPDRKSGHQDELRGTIVDLGGASATVVMLTALELEYEAVRAHLTKLQTHAHQAGTMFEVGQLPGEEQCAAIAVTGVGNRAAAVLAERAISVFRPAALLFVGVAGALDDDLGLGDVVVATKVYAYDSGKDEDDGFLARPVAWPAPYELEQLARHVARTSSWQRLLQPDRRSQAPTVHFRPIAAGEVVLNSRTTPLAQQLHRTYNDAAAVEMESAGVAHAGHVNRSLPVLTIRGISDKADGGKQATDRLGWQPIAAAHAAAFATALAVELATRQAATRGPSSTAQDIGSPRIVQNVTAHAGGVAYAVADGNIYVNQLVPPASAIKQPGNPLDRGAAPGAGSGARLKWRPATEAFDVVWRSDLLRGTSGLEPTGLEVHIVPVGEVERLEVRRLRHLAEELATAGRTRRLFTIVEQLRTDSNDQAAWATSTSTDHLHGPAGLAVHRDGQRSAWAPLPRDDLGAVLGLDDLVGRIEELLNLLAVIDLPAPIQAAIAVGVEPSSLIAEGRIVEMPCSRATMGSRREPHIRIQPDDVLPYTDLLNHGRDVAEGMAARLIATLRIESR